MKTIYYCLTIVNHRYLQDRENHKQIKKPHKYHHLGSNINNNSLNNILIYSKVAIGSSLNNSNNSKIIVMMIKF